MNLKIKIHNRSLQVAEKAQSNLMNFQTFNSYYQRLNSLKEQRKHYLLRALRNFRERLELKISQVTLLIQLRFSISKLTVHNQKMKYNYELIFQKRKLNLINNPQSLKKL